MEAKLLVERLKSLPPRPGVYLMKDVQGIVLYVGKAASLRHRVRSYFGAPNGLEPKVAKMVSHLADFEYIVTDSEQEALILECNLIKKHRPRYNVRLKDDKNYPYLKINLEDQWARIYITRRYEQDGARYFGPFASAKSVRKTMDLLKRLFPYRSCNRTITGADARPCLDYHIHRCVGPCIGAVSQEDYKEVIRQVTLFLDGRHETVLRQLRTGMEQAAENLEFEKAAVLRDQIQAVERTVERQKITEAGVGDQDVVAFARAGDEACVQVFFIRGGKVIGREHFILESTLEEEDRQVMASFIKQFYDVAPYIPPEVLLQHPLEDAAVIGQWLRQKRGGKVKMLVPRRGKKKELVGLVAENAEQELAQLRVQWLADSDKTIAAVEELREQLNLPRLPFRVECYDISNIQGTSAVGSMVVFENGQPKPSDYRRFQIKTVHQADDYAMMQEVLRRRFKRAAVQRRQNVSEEGGKGAADQPQAAGGAWALLPDLLIVDGGKGQLNAALEVMRELQVDFIPTAGLAKENEELFLPDVAESVILPRNSQALYLVQRIRDEAHRFALAYHQRVRQRQSMGSVLDTVPGIGPKRKRALLRHFGSVKAVREASVEDLAAVVGMTRKLAEQVKEYI